MEDKLQELQCPFTWKTPICTDEDFQIRLNEDQNEFVINGFVMFILECYLKAKNDEIEVAIRKAKECVNILEEYKPCGRFVDDGEHLWKRAKDALWHILLSTRAWLAFLDEDMESTEEHLNDSRLVLEDSLDDGGIATIWAIKSKISQIVGFKEAWRNNAVGNAEKAVELDSSVSLWHFQLGKCLARFRRNERPYDPPSEEEIDELTTAWSMCKKPDYAVMLLQSYQVVYNKRNDRKIRNIILQLFHAIKQSASDEWYIYWRCAHVCVRLKGNIVPKEELKELIELAFHYSKESRNENEKHLFEVKASYYKMIERDTKEALRYYRLAADSGESTCVFEVIKLTHQYEPEKDLLPLIEKYMNTFEGKSKNILLIKASYILYVKNDFDKAIEIYLDLMEQQCSLYSLQNWRPLFGEQQRPYNIYEQLLKILEWRSHKQSLSYKEIDNNYKDYLNKVMHFYKLAKNSTK